MDNIQIPTRVVDGDFAGWLRDAMNARRMSARMVGVRTGIDRTTVTRLLYGYREPNLTTLVALLRLFEDAPASGRVPNQPKSPAPGQDLLLL